MAPRRSVQLNVGRLAHDEEVDDTDNRLAYERCRDQPLHLPLVAFKPGSANVARLRQRRPAGPEDWIWPLALIDAAGMRRWRRWAAGSVTGRALELGAGTGRNSRYLPGEAELVAVEPDAKALRYRSGRGRDVGSAVVAPGEALPLPDGWFYSALSTLVLRSVEDPEAAADLRRVLRSGTGSTM